MLSSTKVFLEEKVLTFQEMLKQSSLSSFTRGISMPFRALKLLVLEPGLKRYAILPFFVNIFLYTLIILSCVFLLTQIQIQFGPWNFWGGFGEWLSKSLNQFFEILKWGIGIPLILVISYFSFVSVGMIIASPFNDLLSEKLEYHICENPAQEAQFSESYWKMMSISIYESARIVARQWFLSLLALPFLFIPVIGFIPLFLVTAYHGGMGFMTISADRHRLRRNHKKEIFKNRRWEILGLGVAMELLFFIPFLGLFLLPLGVIAGTMLYCTSDWASLLKHHKLEPPPGFSPPRLK